MSRRQFWLTKAEFLEKMKDPLYRACAWAPPHGKQYGNVCACVQIINPDEPDRFRLRCQTDANTPLLQTNLLWDVWRQYQWLVYETNYEKELRMDPKIAARLLENAVPHNLADFQTQCVAILIDVGVTVKDISLLIFKYIGWNRYCLKTVYESRNTKMLQVYVSDHRGVWYSVAAEDVTPSILHNEILPQLNSRCKLIDTYTPQWSSFSNYGVPPPAPYPARSPPTDLSQIK